MELFKLLKRKGEIWHMHGESYLPNFEAIDVGPYRISVQASKGHYCSPRQNFLEAEEYDSMEILVYYKGSNIDIWKRKFWVDFLKHAPEFAHSGFYQYENYASHPIGWVPVSVINKLYLFLKDYVKTESKD